MLRPVDMTLSIQNAADAARVGAQTARPEVASQMFAERLEKQVEQQSKQVAQSNQSEKSGVQPDRDGNAGGYQPKRKPAQKKPEKKSNTKPKLTGESLYDIKI